MTTVINIRDAPADWRADPRYVYCGRPGKGEVGVLGNRHAVGHCFACDRRHARAEAIALFRAEASERWARDPAFRAEVEGLRGKVCLCFCVPLDCHCYVYLELLGERRPPPPVVFA